MTQSKHWFKGNIHTHTTESDGDASPETVVDWFRRHDYHFLVLSDHNHLTILDHASVEGYDGPLLIPGEEVSVRIHQGKTAIHMNGIGITRVVEPVDAGDTVPTLQANVNAILQAGGIVSINHPNYTWAFDHTHLVKVNGALLLEIFNGHPGVNLAGAPGKPGYEAIWDGVLSAGKRMFGVATDDSHHYSDFSWDRANPGRGWIVVRAAAPTRRALMDALASGDFYASTGVTLLEVEQSDAALALEIEQRSDFLYQTDFVGHDGVVLETQTGLAPRYEFSGKERYVRAVVTSSSGQKAWTQPVFLA
jgi:hypothetical protein